MRPSITGKTRDARLIFTGYAAMVYLMVRFLIHAKTLGAKKLAPVAALRMAMEDLGMTTATTE